MLDAAALVIGWMCTALLPKAETFSIVSRSEFEMRSVASCSFGGNALCDYNSTQRTFMHAEITPTCHELVCHGKFYVTSMNLMHSSMVCSQDHGSVDVPVIWSLVTGSVLVHNGGLMGNGYGTE